MNKIIINSLVDQTGSIAVNGSGLVLEQHVEKCSLETYIL